MMKMVGLILILFLAHVAIATKTLNQIRYEELAETVRNVYFFEHRLIYDGISTNLAWPAILFIIYKIFGFTIFTAKYIRLILVFISIFSLFILLKKTLGQKLAIVPLLTITMSPTLLFYSTMQAQYGMDLLYLPISALLFYLIDFSKPKKVYLQESLAWFITMIGCMSYPGFIFFLPAFSIYYSTKLIKVKSKFFPKHIILSTFSFLTPLVLIYSYFKNRQLLIYDPNTGGGIFRGSGVFDFNLNVFLNNANILFMNLFDKSFGYYFELKNVEFSHFLPILSLVFIAILTFKIFTKLKKLRLIILLALMTIFLNIFTSGFTSDFYPGIRRYSSVIAAIYTLFILVWWFINTQKFKGMKKTFLVGIMLLIPIHHILVYPDNLQNSPNPLWDQFMDVQWFSQAKTPDKSLETFVDHVQKEDLKLSCMDKNLYRQCRYSEIYTAVASSCLWNKLKCHQIYGYDEKSKDFIPLSTDTWDKYIFAH